MTDLPTILAGYRAIVEKAWTPETAAPGFQGDYGSPVGQCGVTAAWLQRRLLEDRAKLTLYVEGTVYLGNEWHPVRHIWLADLDVGIYDLTADQFEYSAMAYVAERSLMPSEVAVEPVAARLALLMAGLS